MVGETLAESGIDPALDWSRQGQARRRQRSRGRDARGRSTRFISRTTTSTRVSEITSAPKELIERLAKDIATIKPAARFTRAKASTTGSTPPRPIAPRTCRSCSPATSASRARAATAGRATTRRRCSRAASSTGPGLQGLGRRGSVRTRTSIRRPHGKDIHAHAYTKDEEPAYWNHGDRPLIVDTPKEGRKVLHRADAHADADQGDLLHQRQPDQQRQVGLRHDQERQSERSS